MQRVVIINYGSGNLHSAAKAFERAARQRRRMNSRISRWVSRAETIAHVEVTDDPSRVASADRIVLPGVGAFADCRAGLDAVSGMYEAIETAVRTKGRPFLGICVGMQLMAERGLEFRITPGFGWIKGDVKAIEPSDPTLKIPHMGWNTLEVINQHPLLAGIPTGPKGLHAYFVHSFHLVTPDRAAVVAEADYGGPVTAMVGAGNIAGTQFHPEKSQTLGLRLISNFLNWKP
jgi:glutamine amidotransferase